MRTARCPLLIALALMPALAAACDLRPLAIVDSVGKQGALSVSFGVADDAAHPTAWQGPLRIANGGAPACVVGDEVAIVERPVMLGNGILYVPTYSGSNNRLYAVDTGNCRVLWRSRDFHGSVRFAHGRFVIGREPVPLDRKCRPLGVVNGGR